jgi:polysaccharide biosynthesis protein PslH
MECVIAFAAAVFYVSALDVPMKILWANCNFLHPPNKGGSIRTLGILKHLQRRNEIHYAALESHPEGPARSREYCFRAYPVPHQAPPRRSLAFALQLGRSLFSPLPLAIERFQSKEMSLLLQNLIRRESFDCLVVDHLPTAVSFPELENSVLFQHNVETVIWERHAGNAKDPLRKCYFGVQAKRMFAFERDVCRTVRHTVAVSPVDAEGMRKMFEVANISEVPTGVDIEYYTPARPVPRLADVVFVGSMDWLPNVDAVIYFVRDILPLIRRKKPECRLAIVGRMPPPGIVALAEGDARILVTGTVADVRPYLWGSGVSIVPMRVGGGTRLKIYESMAAKIPIVSTPVGAEGLAASHPDNIRLADNPRDFADHCLELLENREERLRMAGNAWEMVRTRFSHAQVAAHFETILEATASPVAARAMRWTSGGANLRISPPGSSAA